MKKITKKSIKEELINFLNEEEEVVRTNISFQEDCMDNNCRISAEIKSYHTEIWVDLEEIDENLTIEERNELIDNWVEWFEKLPKKFTGGVIAPVYEEIKEKLTRQENIKKFVKEYKKEQGYKVNDVIIRNWDLLKKEDYENLIKGIDNEYANILSKDKSYIIEIETWYLDNDKMDFSIQLIRTEIFKIIYGEETYIDLFE